MSKTRSIEDLCSINGHRAQPVPPLRPGQVPNLEAIRKVYSTMFATGLDHFLETGPSNWFAQKGFDLLVADQALLAQFLLYLTMVSNHAAAQNNGHIEALASQEARMTWALFSLCTRPSTSLNSNSSTAHGSGVGGASCLDEEDTEDVARRVRAIEAIFTGEPILRDANMSDFIQDHQDEIVGAPPITEVATAPTEQEAQLTSFQRQLLRRSDDFWRLVEMAAEHPSMVVHELECLRKMLDGRENRDIIFSAMLLSTGPGPAANEDNHSPNRSAKRQERELARRFLESEANGRATKLVLANMAGIALRAFQ